MKLLSSFLLLSIIYSCSSLPSLSSKQKKLEEIFGKPLYRKDNSCYSHNRKIEQKHVDTKLYKEWSKPGRYAYGYTENYVFDPIYKNLKMIGGSDNCLMVYSQLPNEKNYYFHNLKTNERTPTQIQRFFYHDYYGYNDDTKTLFVLNSKSPKGIKLTVKNAKTSRNHNKTEKMNLVENGGAYIVEVEENNKRYFQYFNKDLKPGPRFSYVYKGLRIPYVQLESGLVYPALFDGNNLILKPMKNSLFQGFEFEGDKLGYAVFKSKDGKVFYRGALNITRKRLFKYSDDKSEVKVDTLLSNIEKEALDDSFVVIKSGLSVDQAHVSSIEPFPEVSLVQSLKTKQYTYIGSKGFWSPDTGIALLKIINGKYIYTRHFDSLRAAVEALDYNNRRVPGILANKEKKRQYDAAMAKYMKDNEKVFAARRRAREKKQADLNYRNAQAAKNNANRSRFSDIDLTGGQGGDEATRINNAKCRDAANRQNRQAGGIKYGCRNRYGK